MPETKAKAYVILKSEIAGGGNGTKGVELVNRPGAAACLLACFLTGCAMWAAPEASSGPIQANSQPSEVPEKSFVPPPPAFQVQNSQLASSPVPSKSLSEVEQTDEKAMGQKTQPKLNPLQEKKVETPDSRGIITPPPKLVSFNFEEADLLVVLRALADVADVNFILAQGVKVKVSMKVEGLPVTEVFAIMQTILEANNLSAVKVGNIFKILPNEAAQRESGPIGFGKDLEEKEGYFTQIVPLHYLSAERMVKVFQPMISQGKVLAYQETNALILSGPASVIREFVEILVALDVPGQNRDVPQVFVYYVENAKATELANVLKTVFAREDEATEAVGAATRGSESAFSPPAPPRPGVVPEKPEEAPLPSSSGNPLEPGRVGDIRILPDQRTNALIIKATPRDFEIIMDIVKKLDITPKQVVIETLVAEVTLTDTFNLGIEWFIRSGMFTFEQVSSAGAASAFTMSFVDGDDVRFLLNTLSGYTEVNVVTSPHLLTRDNLAARIQIGQEVPIVTGKQSTITATAAGGENVFQTVAQRDVGRILNITPHVSENRQVTLDIDLEISDTLPETTVSGTPSFSKRTISTSVVVEDNQSLLIGGIIDKSTRRDETGIPVLRDIPYLGVLFGSMSDTKTTSELLIMLTPHVIASPEEGKSETERFKKRLDWLEEKLGAYPKGERGGEGKSEANE